MDVENIPYFEIQHVTGWTSESASLTAWLYATVCWWIDWHRYVVRYWAASLVFWPAVDQTIELLA